MSDARTPRNVISVRFSDAEIAQVKAQSDKTGEPVSTIIRKAALQKSAPPQANVGTSNRGGQWSMNARIEGASSVTGAFGPVALTGTTRS